LRQLRDVARAIGFSPSSTATPALIALSKAIPEFIADYDWQHTLLRHEDEEGVAYLLELLLSDTGNLFKGAHHFDGPKVIAEMFLNTNDRNNRQYQVFSAGQLKRWSKPLASLRRLAI
jgi:hypothetical protein